MRPRSSIVSAVSRVPPRSNQKSPQSSHANRSMASCSRADRRPRVSDVDRQAGQKAPSGDAGIGLGFALTSLEVVGSAARSLERARERCVGVRPVSRGIEPQRKRLGASDNIGIRDRAMRTMPCRARGFGARRVHLPCLRNPKRRSGSAGSEHARGEPGRLGPDPSGRYAGPGRSPAGGAFRRRLGDLRGLPVPIRDRRRREDHLSELRDGRRAPCRRAAPFAVGPGPRTPSSRHRVPIPTSSAESA